jgi:phosphotransferase system  glucose/maltose/N-acetylglucosamine-specific IIC component
MTTKTGIIIGVAIAAAAGITFYVIKKRQNKELQQRQQEEQRRKALQAIKTDPVGTGISTGLYNIGL